MSWVATAIVGSAVVGGVVASRGASKAAEAQVEASETATEAQVEAAKIASEAQLKAVGISTEAQERALERSIAFQQKIFDQSRADTAPWRQAGENALFKLLGGTKYGLPKPDPREFMTAPPPPETPETPAIPYSDIKSMKAEREAIAEVQRNYQNLLGREGESAGIKYWVGSGLRGPELTQAMREAAKTYGKTYDVEGKEYENPFYVGTEEEEEEKPKVDAWGRYIG